jgi:hypothetical protein
MKPDRSDARLPVDMCSELGRGATFSYPGALERSVLIEGCLVGRLSGKLTLRQSSEVPSSMTLDSERMHKTHTSKNRL